MGLNLRKAIFVVTYSINRKKEIEYLILKRKRHWTGWEFPKGGVKRWERIKNTIKRELKEEAGLRVVKGRIKNHKHKGIFLYLPKAKEKFELKHDGQKFRLYSVKVGKRKVNLKNNPDEEHSDSRWVDFKVAMKKLTWPNQRKCLNIVNDWLVK
jgi:8-oxo-dGTP pyrophosphatase MutT (NUDIX family)